MIFVGIDPGASGGIAMLSETGEVQCVRKMPETERDILDALTIDGPARAVLEMLRPMPAKFRGGIGNYHLGGAYYACRMALTAARIPFDEAVPRKWQAAMQCLTGGDKNVSKRRAQELFPSVKCTHAISDALLIAEYARRLHGAPARKEAV